MADDRDAAFLTALTTEHFGLQGGRAATISDASSRASLFMGTVSSATVALGLVANVAEAGTLFYAFALTVLPVVVVLGVISFVRVLESGIEDALYGRAINRIRHYYLELHPDRAGYFALSAYDDALGMVANMGLRPSRWQVLFTTASLIAFVTAAIAGACGALALGAAGAPLGVCVAAGALVAMLVAGALMRAQARRWEVAFRDYEPLFPTPANEA